MKLAILVLLASTTQAAELWLARVQPCMNAAEKKAYLSLTEQERPAFEAQFWTGRPISSNDYFQRATYADTTFGSGKAGSGANTDRGRVHLSLGPPNRTTRLPSSRTFFPMEIWYYAEAPAVDIHYELQLLFYQRNGTGEYKLYSPTLNTIKDLMNPQASTRGLFGVNDIVTEADVRTRLTLSPAESEVIDAAVSVARGIKGMGNEQVLAVVASPARALSRDIKTRVTARLLTEKPALSTFQTTSVEGVPQIDLASDLLVRDNVTLEVLEGNVSLARYETDLHFGDTPRLVRYEQRLLLLPGEYRVMLTADGRTHPYGLTVTPAPLRAMLTGAVGNNPSHSKTPFEFKGTRVNTTSGTTQVAVIELPLAARVTWRLRRGIETVWITRSSAESLTVQPLGDSHTPPGQYTLEAEVSGELRVASVRIGPLDERAGLPVVSYNANLFPAERARALGHQYLVRGNATEAKLWLERAWTSRPDLATKIELCRVAALTGHYDEARNDLEELLKSNPDDFDVLSTLAYVEVGLQDYRVAERLYARALSIRKSAAVEKALQSLRQKN